MCQATRTVPATVEVPSGSPDGPYHLCQFAAERMQTRSLAPREWYNLAVLFGPFAPDLHDDFYDDDGTACQPRAPVPSYGDERDRVPDLFEVAGSIEDLVDFLQTRWWIDEHHKTALRAHPPQLVLEVATRRYTSTLNPDLRAVLETILAVGAREDSLSWFRERIAASSAEERLHTIARAAGVLPADEAFALAVGALTLISAEARHNHLHCLFVLRDATTPSWIERNACSPVVNTWGRLAAACNVDWPTTQRWLGSGRPLSLVALDSIVERVPHPGKWHRQPPPPRLLVPGGVSELAAALQKHLERDQSPRVQQLATVGLSRLSDIVA
jgi:hypothetical protein